VVVELGAQLRGALGGCGFGRGWGEEVGGGHGAAGRLGAWGRALRAGGWARCGLLVILAPL
jgi:hypothetical protein